ncbi:MAG TPA: ADP-ribosylglycohydrolase family protein [Gammaproteobacteria bacterium]|nr:ADP-ribosylglycohydrolase family protein [Gammaproteobacteria bacterium]
MAMDRRYAHGALCCGDIGPLWTCRAERARASLRRFAKQPFRGYGMGAARPLSRINAGGHWREEAPKVFRGGSFGNGGAMRAAPIGAYFARDTLRAVHEARLAAQITHSHVDGQAGAVAAAASLLAAGDAHDAGELLLTVARLLPVCATRAGIEHACDIHYADHARAVRELGTGEGLSAQDTVPFCLWCAFHNGTDVRAALWHTVAGLGDRDTTYAIVGGVVALSAGGVPVEWIERREPLPAAFFPRR